MRNKSQFLSRLIIFALVSAPLLSGHAWATGEASGYKVENETIAVKDGPGGQESLNIDAALYIPDGAGPGHPVPAVIGAHGFGGNKDELKTYAVSLSKRGYAVLLYSARGFGRTGGQIGLGSADYDLADVRQLVDWLATRPEVALDKPGDPRVGMFGVSYGGGMSLLAAATDSRIDAIVPIVAWNSLVNAFNPGDVFKQQWASVFFSTPPGESQPCGPFVLLFCLGFNQTVTSGRLSPVARDLLARSSPAAVIGQIKIPTMLVQGETDTLFPLSEAEASAAAIRSNGAPVKVMWIAGGHSASGPIGRQAHTRAAVERWLDRWLKHRPDIKTGPAFEWQVANAWSGDNQAPRRGGLRLSLDLRGGLKKKKVAAAGAVGFANPPGGQPASFSDFPGAGLAGGGFPLRPFDLPGQAAVFESDPLRKAVTIVGFPHLKTTLTTTTGEGVVFAKIYDVGPDGSTTLPGLGVAPLRVSGAPGDALAVDVDLAGIAYRFDSRHRIRLVVAATDQGYANLRAPERYAVQTGSQTSLALPVFSPAVSAKQAARTSPAWLTLGLGVLLSVAFSLLRYVRGKRSGGESNLGEKLPVDAHNLVGATSEVETPLILEGLTKQYGDVLAVDHISLEVHKGQVFGLLGPNGAGKTTALRMALGLVHPSAGRSLIFGSAMQPGHPVLRRVGVIIEGPGFVPHLSGVANLKLWWRAGGRPMEEAGMKEALEIAGLGAAADRAVKTYSHGMRQRLAMAQALLGNPELLILDEPTDGLDPQQILQVRRVLAGLAEQGRTIVLSSHLLSEVEQVCSHVAVMVRGRVVANGTVADIIGTEKLVYVQTSGNGSRDLALRLLSNMDGVSAFRTEGEGLVVTLDGLARPQLVADLSAAGVPIATVASHRRLEDAFVGLVEEES